MEQGSGLKLSTEGVEFGALLMSPAMKACIPGSFSFGIVQRVQHSLSTECLSTRNRDKLLNAQCICVYVYMYMYIYIYK